MTKNNQISILGANIIFLFGVITLVSVDVGTSVFDIQVEILGISTIIVEFLFFLVPSCLYILYKRKNIKYILRINKISIGNVLIIMLMMLFAIPVIGLVNYMIQLLINTIGRPLPNPIPEIKTISELIMGIIVIALTPAICEEVMARGVFMRAYERYGVRTALTVAAVLFSIMHRNIQTFIPIFLMGLLLGYVVYRTNSIIAGMIAHFTNNAFSTIVAFAVSKLQKLMGTEINEIQTAALPQMDMMASLFLLGIVISSGIIFAGLFTLFRHNTEKTVRKSELSNIEQKGKVKFAYYMPMIIGLIIISVELIFQINYILS